jgi:putative ABC transport system permease protein
MNLVVGFRVGVREILAHKFRTFLTMLGIILGVASLMAMFALTAGIAKGMRETLQMVGGIERVEIVSKDVSEENLGISEISPGRTMADVYALRDGAPLISHISPESTLHGAAATLGSKTARVSVGGVSADYLQVENHELGEGRWFSPIDFERHHRVAVIGRGLWEELAGRGSKESPVGKTILINQHPFTIIGAFIKYERESEKQRAQRASARESRGGRERRDPFHWKNRALLIPIETMLSQFKSANVGSDGMDQGPQLVLDRLNIRVADTDRFDEALDQVSNVLRGTHRGIDDFGYNTREDWFDRVESGVRSTRMSGSLIAGISLLVGGIGITNIMLASISERVREIGVRRAVGATPMDIFSQIIVESVLIGLIGGVLGLVASGFLLQVLAAVAPSENPPIVEPSSILISFSFSVIVGIVSGLYPAWKASTLNPIQALRYE